MEKLEWTGERYVPWADDYAVAYEHLHRYGFAKEFVRGKKVLDLASGEGYGSFILSETAESVVGIDIDDLSVRHASARYAKENLRFIKGSITEIPLEGKSLCDVIVCFEAIEHIEDHDALFREIKRLLKADGILIISSPNKYIYSDVPNYQNPFHMKELYLEEFQKLLSDNFTNVYLYGQRILPSSNIFPLFNISKPSTDLVIDFGRNNEFVFLPPSKKIAKYFVAVASNEELNGGILGSSYLVDQSESIWRKKDSSILQLNNMVRQKDEQLKAKDDQFLRKSEELSTEKQRLEKEVRQRDEKISELAENVRAKEEEINRLVKSVEELSSEKQRLEKEVRQWDEKVKSLAEDMRAKNQEINRFATVVKETEGKLRQTEDHLRQKEEEIKKKEEVISADRIFKDKCVAMLNEYKETVSAYEDVLAEKERLDAELAKTDTRIEELLNSLSWKVTGPLRAVYGLWLKGKRKPGAGKD